MTPRRFYSCCGLLCWLLLVPTPALAIDCGCPKTCTAEALSESNGAPFACGARIAWMMKAHDDPEANACKAASKDPSLDAATNANRPCRFEACNPNGGCKSNLIVDPNPHPNITCGCDSCNAHELAKVQGGQNEFTCEARISHYMHRWHLLEWDACAAASGNESSCNATACDPLTCGSNLTRVAKNYSKDNSATPVGFAFGLLLVLLMVLPATVIVYRNRRKQAAAAAALQPKGRDDHPTEYKDADHNDDGVELSSSYKDDPRKAKHVPPNHAFKSDDSSVMGEIESSFELT